MNNHSEDYYLFITWVFTHIHSYKYLYMLRQCINTNVNIYINIQTSKAYSTMSLSYILSIIGLITENILKENRKKAGNRK